jgi:hypothetical protein
MSPGSHEHSIASSPDRLCRTSRPTVASEQTDQARLDRHFSSAHNTTARPEVIVKYGPPTPLVTAMPPATTGVHDKLSDNPHEQSQTVPALPRTVSSTKSRPAACSSSSPVPDQILSHAAANTEAAGGREPVRRGA